MALLGTSEVSFVVVVPKLGLPQEIDHEIHQVQQPSIPGRPMN